MLRAKVAYFAKKAFERSTYIAPALHALFSVQACFWESNMDKATSQQLASMQAHEFNAACDVLRDSGFGELADDWIASRQEFEAERKLSPIDVSGALLQAYARMRMSWFKISQLRDAARQRLERRDHR